MTTKKPLSGFQILREEELPEQRGVGVLLEHASSGARVFSMAAADAENMFAVGFPTPPEDDSGLPHILEHSVLAGSRKFPLKDPFMELTKMSMATFLNAMTYSDRTIYPVASNVEKDFFNLSDVYFDAVFHPLLTRYTFMQEGHRLAFSTPGDSASDLIVKGIVFNEMKGAYANPASRSWELGSRGLFPDTPYGKDSGGDPERIPDLTWENLTAYHRRYYHPSNAYIFFYGNIGLEKKLEFLAERLAGYDRISPPKGIARQSRWIEPRSIVAGYPIGPEDSLDEKAFHSVDWIVGDATDIEDSLALEILSQLLLGNEAAPLLKAIIDSKLGHDLSYSGYSGGSLEGTFRVSLMGSEPHRGGAFLDLVLTTLDRISSEPMNEDRVDAAFQQLTYQTREIEKSYPLHLMDRVYPQWVHHSDPFPALHAGEYLNRLKARYLADKNLFRAMIRERLLSNSHRIATSLVPNRELQRQKDDEFATRMTRRKSAMSPEMLEEVLLHEKELARIHATPDSPDTIALLPCLAVSEIPKRPLELPVDLELIAGGSEILRARLFSNEVSYLTIGFDLDDLPDHLYGLLPLYSQCVQKMGAGTEDFQRIAERVSAHTGGVEMWSHLGFHQVRSEESVRRARFSMKFLTGQEKEALSVFRAILFEMNPWDKERLRDVATQSYAAMRENVIDNALAFASRHADRHYGVDARLRYLKEGLPQFRFLEKLSREFDSRWEAVASGVDEIREYLMARRRLSASITAPDESYGRIRGALIEWCEAMSQSRPPQYGKAIVGGAAGEAGLASRSGLAAPIEISFCVRSFPITFSDAASLASVAVGSRLLSVDYMVDRIRIKGGAYGAACGYNELEHTYKMHSYRDPWVRRTLDVFSEMEEYVRNASWSQTQIDHAILGTAKSAARPIRPHEATGLALKRRYFGESENLRAERHEAILGTRAKDVKKVMTLMLEEIRESAQTCVVTSRDRLEAANAEMRGAELEIVDVLK